MHSHSGESNKIYLKTGNSSVAFDLIDEADIEYINQDSELGVTLRGALIDSNMDDDVMTDDELVQGAKNMLDAELTSALAGLAAKPANLWLL